MGILLMLACLTGEQDHASVQSAWRNRIIKDPCLASDVRPSRRRTCAYLVKAVLGGVVNASPSTEENVSVVGIERRVDTPEGRRRKEAWLSAPYYRALGAQGCSRVRMTGPARDSLVPCAWDSGRLPC